MSAIVTLADALRPAAETFAIKWGVVSRVIVGPQTTVVDFNLFGSPSDAASSSNLKLARVGTLNPGDRIAVARMGSGGWVILDRVVPMEEGT